VGVRVAETNLRCVRTSGISIYLTLYPSIPFYSTSNWYNKIEVLDYGVLTWKNAIVEYL